MARDMKVWLTIGLKDLVTKGLDGVSNKLKSFEGKSMMIGAGLSAAGLGITGAFIASAKASAAFGSEIQDLSSRTGLSAEVLTGLKYACGQVGAELGNVQMAVKTLSTKGMEALQKPTSESGLAFKRLGVSLVDSTGKLKSTETLFFEIGNGLRGVTDSAERTALATQLLGRGGMMLMPVFNDAKSSLKDFMEEAKSLGLVLDKKTVASLDDLDDSMAKVKAQTGAAFRLLSVVAVPAMLAVSEGASKLLAKLTKLAGAHPTITKLGLIVLAAAGVIMAALGPVFMALPGITALWDRLSAAQIRNLAAARAAAAANVAAGEGAAAGGAGAAAGAGGGVFAGFGKNLGAALKHIALLSVKWLVPVGAAIATLWGAIAGAVTTAATAIAAFVAGIGGGTLALILLGVVWAILQVILVWKAWAYVIRNWGGIVDAAKAKIEAVKSWFRGLIDYVRGLPAQFLTAGEAMVQGLIDGLKSKWGELTGWFKAGLQKLRDMLPFSEPKSGPLRGLKQSGATAARMFGQGFGGNMQLAFAAPAVGRGGAGGGGGGTVIQNNYFTINDATDPEKVGRIVEHRMRGTTDNLRYGYAGRGGD